MLQLGELIHTFEGQSQSKSYEIKDEDGSVDYVYHNLREIRFLEDGKIDINKGALATSYKVRQGVIKMNNTSDKEKDPNEFNNFGKVVYENGSLMFVRNQSSSKYKDLPSGEKLRIDTPEISTSYYKAKPEVSLASELIGTKWDLIAQLTIEPNGETKNSSPKTFIDKIEHEYNGKKLTHYYPKNLEFTNNAVLVLNDGDFAAQYEIFNDHLLYANSNNDVKYATSQGELKLDGDNLILEREIHYTNSTSNKPEISIEKLVYRASK